MSKKKKREFQKPMRPLPFKGAQASEGEGTNFEKPTDEPMRLNKYIAHAGICSRRAAAELVKKGDISVNGEVELNPSYMALPTDKVMYKGKELKQEETFVYILMNKPKDAVTTLSDERNRRTVMDIIGDKVKERIYPVGRLDRATTGLLLLTNDGDLAKKLSHPSHEITKFYQVTTDIPVTKAHIKEIAAGLTLEDGFAPVDSVDFVRKGKDNEVGIGIHIGRNRIVRRIFGHLGYEVMKLDRVYYAGLTKKDMPRGWFRHLTAKEVIMLKHFT
jgi:23S rRNA pseudouridine2605 synthase